MIKEVGAEQLLFILASIGVLGIVTGWISNKLNIPDVVFYLITGVIVGPAFLNLISIDAYPLSNDIILTFGSAFILYEGGREIKLKVLNNVKITVALLSTLGVFLSAIIVGAVAYFVFDISVITALLIGSIIASTDPASLIPVFKQVSINDKIKQTVISESAFNDAAGAILVSSILASITSISGSVTLSDSLIKLILMILIGTMVGFVVAYLGVGLASEKIWGIFHDYAPIISILIVVFAYDIAEVLGGSGYMAVFIAGLVAGNKKMFGLWVAQEEYLSGIYFRENIATLARMSIFIILGTHVDMTSLIKYGIPSLIVVFSLMFIARPLVVLVCALFDKKAQWNKNELLFMMWVRETGVIPAALSGIVVSMQLPGYEIISSVVFTTILITLLLQASTTKLVAQKLDVLEK